MLRCLKALVLAIAMGQWANAALLVSYDFNSGNAPSFVLSPVSAGAFTPASGLQGAGLVTPTYPGGPWTQAYMLSQSAQASWGNPVTFTLSSPIQIKVESISFDLGGTVNLGNVRLSNNITSEVFGPVASVNNGYKSVSYSFLTPIVGNSITFTFESQSIAGLFKPTIDNLQVTGIVPEPGSMAIVGVLSAVGFCVRRSRRRLQ